MKKQLKIAFCLLLSMILVSCSASNENTEEVTSNQTQVETQLTTSLTRLDTSEMFSTRDSEIGYDENSATKIFLNNESVKITEEGIYILSGSINDGQVIVEVKDTEKVQLILNGVNITSSNSAAIYIKSADKVFITLATDSTNTLTSQGEFVSVDENNVDGTIFSKSDLTLNGNGNLAITSKFGHGIVGKDDVVFVGGNYTITAEKHGISANDSVRIATGDFLITSGKDGIQVENTENTDKGFIYIGEGNFKINSQGDGISSSGICEIENGYFEISTGEGSQSVTHKSSEVRFDPSVNQQTTQSDETSSQKGIKSDSIITILNGEFKIDSVDDGIHATSDISLLAGNYEINTGDDAIHSDTNVVIDSGTYTIPYCYEGIEGLTVTINGGDFEITSSDDGINAAGGNDNSGFNGMGGKERFSATEGAFITINGGNINIVSGGDSIDSNGALTINGGTLNLTCNGQMDTAIDSDGTYTNSGGTVNTNDGSENGGGMQGGKPNGGAPGQKPNLDGVPNENKKPTKS